jgi:hypothetical protein
MGEIRKLPVMDEDELYTYAKAIQAHDRWIEIVREDGSKARLYIGRSLDFIQPDGTLRETYLVHEEVMG